MTFLIIYCAFTYGVEFSKMIDVLTDEETKEMFKYDIYPYVLLPFIIALIAFLFAPITFIIQLIYNSYVAIKGE